MTVKLYDTNTRTIRDFHPLNPPYVGLYACGPTVYNYAHLGNLRTYLFVDQLTRVLTYTGYKVREVINITDVGHLVSDADEGEDKMEKGSRRTGKSAWEIAEFYAQAFISDFQALNILQPTIWCKATDHIPEQINFIRCIEEKGFCYRTSDGIYFDTTKLDAYGTLARLDVDGLRAGSRVELGEKRNITDFALWKFSPEGEQRQMEWESPWGIGFPGWHIECSAMSIKYLGPYFDIHTGGEDHIPVHHTNEIAQTQACHGTNLANFWMHGYFLNASDGRMAKSKGEFLRLQSVVDRGYDPLTFRYFCLNGHYRTQLSFSWESIDGAATALQRLRNTSYAWGAPGQVDAQFLARFKEQINNDLNMPRALAVAWDLVRSDCPPAVKKGTILEFDKILGLGLESWQPAAEPIPADVAILAKQRVEARAGQHWALADDLRDQILAAGYQVEDTPQGPRIRPLK